MFDLYYKYSTSSWLIRFLVFLKVIIMMGIVVMNAKMIKTSTEIVAKYYARYKFMVAYVIDRKYHRLRISFLEFKKLNDLNILLLLHHHVLSKSKGMNRSLLLSPTSLATPSLVVTNSQHQQQTRK